MALLEYEFRVLGKNVVDQALASIERRIAQHNAFVRRQLGGQQAVARTATSVSPAAAMRAMQSEERRAAQQQQREAARLHAERMRQTKVEAREKERAQKAAAAAAAREEKQLARDLERQREYWAKARHASTLRRIKDEERAQKRAEREQLRVLRERETFIRSTLGGAGQRVLGTAASVGRTGAAMVGISGSFLAAASISQALKLDEAARRFAIAAREPGKAELDPEVVRRRAVQVGIARGIAPEAVMAGMAGFQAATGEAEFAMQAADLFATFAQATDSAFEDIAASGAALFENFKVKDVQALGDALAKLAEQARRGGTFEMKNLAKRLPQITAGFAARGMGIEALPEIGAVAQIAMKSFGTGEEAAARTSTALDALFRQLIAKADDIESGAAFGGRRAQVFRTMGDATSGIRTDIGTLIADVVAASRGNLTELQKVFGDEGGRGIAQFVGTFQQASAAAGGGERGIEAGRRAVLERIQQFSQLPANMAEVERAATDAMKATSVQLEILNAKLKDAISSEFFPALERVAPHLERLVPAVATLAEKMVKTADWFARNPFSGIGAVLAGLLTIEIAKGAIGPKVADAIVQLILRQTARAPTAPTPPGGTSPVIVGGPGGGAGTPKPGGGRFGRLAGAGGKLLGAGSGALFGHGMGTLVGGAVGGEKGAETLGRVGAGAGAGAVLGPAGAIMGAALGAAYDSIMDFREQIAPMGDFFQEMERLAELRRRADERLEEARRNGGRFIAPADQIQTSINQSIEPPNMSVDPMMSVPGVVVPKLDTSNVQTELDAFRNDIIKVRSELSKLRVPDAPNRSVSPSPIKG